MPQGAKRKMTVRMRSDAFNPDAGTFSAYITVYDVTYDVGWGFQEKISPGAFDESIRDNPVVPVMWEHDWRSGPVGSAQLTSDNRGVKADGKLYLDQDSDLVKRVYQSMLDGAVDEYSIAFWPEEISWSKEDPKLDDITKGDLAEATICVRGANPETETLDLRDRPLVRIVGDRDAELARLRSAHEGRIELAAVASHSTATSDSSWDGPGNESKINADQLPGIGPKEWAWRDSGSDGKSKADWKFPHHFVTDGSPAAASTVACSSIVASLNGGRGGSSIPDGDRSGVYAHAKKHLTDAGKDVPELKSAGDVEAASRSEDVGRLLGMLANPSTRDYAREALSSRLETSEP